MPVRPLLYALGATLAPFMLGTLLLISPLLVTGCSEDEKIPAPTFASSYFISSNGTLMPYDKVMYLEPHDDGSVKVVCAQGCPDFLLLPEYVDAFRQAYVAWLDEHIQPPTPPGFTDTPQTSPTEEFP